MGFQHNPVSGAATGVSDPTKVAKAGDSMSGALTLPANPTSANHAANKAYVDSLSSGQLTDWKDAVSYITTGNITLSGLGAASGRDWSGTLTADTRIGVIRQTNGADNGIYLAKSGTWVRATDMDGAGELSQGTAFLCALSDSVTGTNFAGSQWFCTTSGTITIGVTTTTWVQTQVGATLGAGSVTSTHLADGTIVSGDLSTNLLTTDGTLAANSDTRIATQKATKTYVDTKFAAVAYATPQLGGLLIAHSSSSAEAQAAAYAVATGTNFVTSVQNAINAIDGSSAGAGDVILAPMRVTDVAVGATGIKMKTAVNVRGAGRQSLGTQLILASGTAPLFSLNDVNVHGCYVGDFWIDGGDAAATSSLIDFDNDGGGFTGAPSTSPDPRITIAGIFARGFGGGTRNGIKVGDNGRVYSIQDNYMLTFSGSCYDLNCVDSHITDCHGLDGQVTCWYIKGNNNRILGCKSSFGNGTADWIVSGQRNSLAACEAQDAEFHGMTISGRGNTVQLYADQNGRGGTGYGVNLTASRNTVQVMGAQYDIGVDGSTQEGLITCSSSYNKITAVGSQHAVTAPGNASATGVALTGTAHHNTIDVNLEDFATGMSIAGLSSAQINFVTGSIYANSGQVTFVDDSPTGWAAGSFVRLMLREGNGSTSLLAVG
jgi:hypothetical protein